MPIQSCRKDGKPAYKWGDKGKAYTYESGNKASRDAARKKAADQGKAIKANQAEDEDDSGEGVTHD